MAYFWPMAGPERDRARARLAGSHAITSAVAVADTIYNAAGVDAIFSGSPFERRFRDIHTVSHQIQSRNAHYEPSAKCCSATRRRCFYSVPLRDQRNRSSHRRRAAIEVQ
jgi:hypothetical protein